MGIHRKARDTRATQLIGAALTAGALLLAPVGAAIVAPGVAYAAPPGTVGPGNPGGGVTPPTVTKKVIHLPFLKIEIKTVQGQQPKIKFVPFPNVHLGK